MSGRWLPAVVLAVLVTACSDDGSSSGGPGFAGRYEGEGTGTFTASGGAALPVEGPIVLTIDGSGNVTVNPGTPQAATGQLSGDSFSIMISGQELSFSGFSCSGAGTLIGEVQGNLITGSFAATGLVCDGSVFNLVGSFSATRTG